MKRQDKGKKYLWFGYGNYTGQGNLQVPAGNMRDPGVFEALSEEPTSERSPLPFFACAVLAVIAVMGFVMLLAWGVSTFLL